MKKLNSRGFTIIEMVIVIAIIGILAAVLIPTYGNVVSNANASAALQTARSTMTNWLASSTTSAGVPTSGTDAHGNQFYAAYFEYNNGESGATTYQYRYTSGGVERTDDNASFYVNFSDLDHVDGYLTTPATDSNFDSTSYKVTFYRKSMTCTVSTCSEHGSASDKSYYNYFVKESANSAYSAGGADVYAASSESQVFYEMGALASGKTLADVNNWVSDYTTVKGYAGTADDANLVVTFTKHTLSDTTGVNWTTASSNNDQSAATYTLTTAATVTYPTNLPNGTTCAVTSAAKSGSANTYTVTVKFTGSTMPANGTLTVKDGDTGLATWDIADNNTESTFTKDVVLTANAEINAVTFD